VIRKKHACQNSSDQGEYNDKKYAVIGAGHGGKAMAAHIWLSWGFRSICSTVHRSCRSHQRGGIELESAEGGPHGFGELALVTSKIAEAIKHVEVIMVVLPSSAHADIAKAIAPHLKSGQIVVLHPGRTCGALEFAKVIRENGCKADVTIAEAETFIYASRSDGPAQARIFRIKEAVPLAALPASRTQCVLDRSVVIPNSSTASMF
jgi:opine dehydrogenase